MSKQTKQQKDKLKEEELSQARRKASQMTLDFLLFGQENNLTQGVTVFDREEWQDVRINSLAALVDNREYSTEHGNRLVRHGEQVLLNGIPLAEVDLPEDPLKAGTKDIEADLLDLALPAMTSDNQINQELEQPLSRPSDARRDDDEVTPRGEKGVMQTLFDTRPGSSAARVGVQEYWNDQDAAQTLVSPSSKGGIGAGRDRATSSMEVMRSAPTARRTMMAPEVSQRKKMSAAMQKENNVDERKTASQMTIDFLLFSDSTNLGHGAVVFDETSSHEIRITSLEELEVWHKYRTEQGNTIERTKERVCFLNGIEIEMGKETSLKIPEKMNLHIEFFSAAGHGDLEKIRELVVKHGVNIHAKDSAGHTALHWAALNNRLEVTRFLCKQGSKLDAGSREGHTALHWAALRGHMDIAECLLDHKADVNKKDNYGYSPLIHATQYGKIKMGKYLIDRGCGFDPDDLGHTPLHWAAYQGFEEMARFIHGNGGENCLESKDKDGCTPLHRASSMGKQDVVNCLLSQGASVLAKDKRGCTPQQLAKRNNHSRVAELLEA